MVPYSSPDDRHLTEEQTGTAITKSAGQEEGIGTNEGRHTLADAIEKKFVTSTANSGLANAALTSSTGRACSRDGKVARNDDGIPCGLGDTFRSQENRHDEDRSGTLTTPAKSPLWHLEQQRESVTSPSKQWALPNRNLRLSNCSEGFLPITTRTSWISPRSTAIKAGGRWSSAAFASPESDSSRGDAAARCSFMELKTTARRSTTQKTSPATEAEAERTCSVSDVKRETLQATKNQVWARLKTFKDVAKRIALHGTDEAFRSDDSDSSSTAVESEEEVGSEQNTSVRKKSAAGSGGGGSTSEWRSSQSSGIWDDVSDDLSDVSDSSGFIDDSLKVNSERPVCSPGAKHDRRGNFGGSEGKMIILLLCLGFLLRADWSVPKSEGGEFLCKTYSFLFPPLFVRVRACRELWRYMEYIRLPSST